MTFTVAHREGSTTVAITARGTRGALDFGPANPRELMAACLSTLSQAVRG